MSEEKQRHVVSIYELCTYRNIVGIASDIVMGNELGLDYSDDSMEIYKITQCYHNILENPISGETELTIRVSMKKEEE